MLCQKCNSSFPVRAWVDGKQKNLQHRKFCFDCSPFGKHNTRNLCKGPSLPRAPRTCKICGKDYRNKGTICSSCRVTTWRQRVKKQLVDYRGGKCILCGYDMCLANMIFHHMDPTDKDFTISGQTKSFERLKKEVDKCVLLCCRCHGEVHAGIVKLPEVFA